MSPTSNHVSDHTENDPFIKAADTGKEKVEDIQELGNMNSMEDNLKTGKLLTENGFSAFKQGNLDEAIEFFSEGLDLLVPHVGQLSEALGPIYLAYGRALMQIAVQNMDAMMVNQAKVPAEALEAKKAAEEEANAAATTSSVGPSKKLIDLPDIIQEDEEVEHDEEDGDDDDESKPSEQSVEDDFQLAWEILDMARIIYAKQSTPTAIQVLSDIYCDLGDLQMENEQFDSAINDYKEALALLENQESKDMNLGLRALASVQFKISMAHEYKGDIQAALPPLEKALSLLKSCTASDADLTELVKELGMKLVDIKTSIDRSDLLKKQVVDDSGEAAFNPSAAQGAQVNDLSNLVKKRKVPQSGEDEAAKKSKTE